MQLFPKVYSGRHRRCVLHEYSVTIATKYGPLCVSIKTPHTNSMLITWQESLPYLETTIEYLAPKQHVLPDTLSRKFNSINIPPTRYSISFTGDKYSSIAKLQIMTHNIKYPTPYIHIRHQLSLHLLRYLAKTSTLFLPATALESMIQMIRNIENHLTSSI